jgi:hypothetical protein
MKQGLFILLVFISFQGFSQKQFKIVKIGELEVMKKNLGQFTWYETKTVCEKLGDGWRLPTRDEVINTLYPNKAKIPKLKKDDFYWSVSDDDSNFVAGHFSLRYGHSYGVSAKNSTNYVRLVRNIK